MTETPILILIIIILVIFLTNNFLVENYQSRKEKADTIYNWFSSNKSHTYKEYREDVPDTDIVEYSTVKPLAKKADFTVDKVLEVI